MNGLALPAFLARERRFAALAAPDGVTIAEVRRGREGWELVSEWRRRVPSATAADAARQLVALLAEAGVRRGRVSVVVRDLAVHHRTVQLPPAAPALLRPIVLRELQRDVPDVAEPVVGFVALPTAQTGAPLAGSRQDYLTAIAPRTVPDAFDATFGGAGLVGQHLTVLPQALQQLYTEADGAPEGTALLMFVDGGPVIGFFQDGLLRYLAEPKALDQGMVDADALVAQLERGAIFLRQQFRGAVLTRLLVASETRAQLEAVDKVQQQLGLRVEPFVPVGGSPAALLAFGAALDEAAGGLTLFEPSEARQPRTFGAVEAVTLGAWAAALLAVAWAAWSAIAMQRLEGEIARTRTEAAERLATLAPAVQTAERRQAVSDANGAIGAVYAEHAAMRQAIVALASAAPAGISLDSVAAVRDSADPTRWRFVASGFSRGLSGAQVVRALDEFYRRIPGAASRGVTLVDRQLDQLVYDAQTDSARLNELTLRFRITFGATRPAPGSEGVASGPPPAVPTAAVSPAAPDGGAR